jgi:hypothetical protein
MQSMPSYRVLFYMMVFAVATSMLGGCAPRKLMLNEFVRMVQTGLPAVEQEQDLQLLAQSMPAHIKLMETLLAGDPRNTDLLILLARLYGGYAFAVLETESEARRWDQPSALDMALSTPRLEDAMPRYFLRGAEYALRALEVSHPRARQQLQSPQSADLLIKALTIDDVPALFWYGFNLGGHIQHRLDSVTAMAQAPLVEMTMQRVVALNSAYYHGSAHLVLLAYYGSRSPMTGGNPALAEAHFTHHQQLVPGPMGLRQLYWARYVLVQRQEREPYVQLLTQVSRASASGRAGGLLASVAAARARIYLGAVDQFFD